MFTIRKINKKASVVIRPATSKELLDYDKNKKRSQTVEEENGSNNERFFIECSLDD